MQKRYKSIVLLDKPSGPTSLECAERAKKILGASKAGHAGTLDPKATGVLLIALDEATKAMPLLMGLEKEYEGVMHIHEDFSEKHLREVAEQFRGKITQTPPVRSAVSRKPRKREIYSFEITKISGRDVSFRVYFQAGTYIRKLCSDMGERMGSGAHMKSLNRVKTGPFSIEECATLEDIQASPGKHMISLENALERIGIKRILIKQGSIDKILNGSPVFPDYIEKSDKGIKSGEIVAVFSGEKVIALALANAGKSFARTDRVFRF
jgi:H/ACA ribonucleoprotein complex subunit 4